MWECNPLSLKRIREENLQGGIAARRNIWRSREQALLVVEEYCYVMAGEAAASGLGSDEPRHGSSNTVLQPDIRKRIRSEAQAIVSNVSHHDLK